MSHSHKTPPARGPALRAAAAMGLSAFALAGSAFAQQAAGPPRAATIVVLDGSNSMNGRLPNDRSLKYVTVRDALRASLPKIAGTEVGLAAFGARRASDCNDAEVVAAPSRDTGAMLAALDRFQPRGFSPVALALRTAAKALPPGVEKASLIVVLDDLASCRSEDPCAVAAGLKRANPALAVHVVVLGPRPADLPVLACMVKQTGGQLFQVADGPGIAPAIEEVLAIAALDPASAPKPPAPVAARPAAGPIAAVRPAQPTKALGIDASKPGLHLTAKLSESAPTLLVPIEWQIWRADALRTGDTASTVPRREAAPLLETTAPAVSRVLPPGRYEIEAKAGLVTARRAIEIASEGPMPVSVDLAAAMLTISAPMTKGTTPAAGTTIEVHGIGGTTAPMFVEGTGARDLVVPPGSYRIKANAGLASAERVVTVGPGVTSDVELTLGAGRLVVAELTAAATASPPRMVVETDDPASAAGRRELYRTTAPRLDIVVPAGSYLITVRREATEIRDRVQVRPGEIVERTGTLAAARVRLVSRIGPTLPPGLPVHYRVERLDPPVATTRHWSEPEPALTLTPGRYRLEARIGGQNAVAVRDVELRAGAAEQRIELDAAAGAVRLKLPAVEAGHGLGDVYWQIFTDRGEAVWRTVLAEPLLALAAGRYRARAEVRGRAFERIFDVRTGENRVIEVTG